jgi:hypothetical protein
MQKYFEFLQKQKKTSSLLLARKFNLKINVAQKIHLEYLKLTHIEARKLAKEVLENI